MNRQTLSAHRVLSITLLTGLMAASAVLQAVELGREGRPTATIVHGGTPEPAAILQHYLKAISDAELTITDVPSERGDRPAVILELVERVRGASRRATASQAYRLQSKDNTLLLQAATERGLLYAVYGLLEDHLGVRFFAPDCEVVPKQTTLILKGINEVREPAFQVRSTFMALGPNRPNPWELRNRGGGVPVDIMVSNHNFYQWAPPSRHLHDNPDYEQHPEWYVLIDGKRQEHWLKGLCYSNPELAKQMAMNIMESIRKSNHPEDVPIKVGQGDGFVACECEVCREVVKQNESEGAPVILMLNRILEAMAPEFPDHQLITFAYAQTIRLPKNIKPHPNLWINIVSSSAGGEGWGPFSGGDMIGTIRDNPHNKLYREATEQWTDAAPGRVAIWHWSTDFNDQSCEWPNLFTMADNIDFWRDQAVAAVALQTTGGGGNWGWLKHWVWLKLMWNPDAEIEPLVQEFLTGYYGPKAAPILWEYHQYVEQVRQESGYAANACDSRAANAMALIQNMFTPEKLERMDSLLAQSMDAAAAEDDPAYKERVAHARAYSVDQLKLVEAAGVKPYPGGYFYPPESVELHRVKDPRDGSYWLVPGGTPDMPARVERRVNALEVTGAQEWGAAFMTRFWFKRGAGGKLTRIENKDLAIEVCPNLLGTITSIVHKPTGKELLTGRFPLVEWHSGMRAMEWFLPEIEPRSVVMEQWIQTDNWFYMGNKQRYHRTLELAENKPVLQISRRFQGDKLSNEPGMPNPTVFPSTWRFKIPEPANGTLIVTAQGKAHTLSLAEKGDLDVVFERQEETAEATEIIINRGDGLSIRLTTPVDGWAKLTAAAVPEQHEVVISLHGEPVKMSREPHQIPLPQMTMEAFEQ